MASRTSSAFKRVALALAAVVTTGVVVEGLVSWGLFAFNVATRAEVPLVERSHTRYDAELGWVSSENVSVPDLYGPGLSLNTNERGFRGSAATPERVPPGKLRLIASGDSMTLGFGVGDANTWVARLAALDPRLETVNMGQGGYGVDQAYLWYARDAADLDHDVLLFAFIMSDITRMAMSSYSGYGKPRLRLSDDGALEVTNVPVPQRVFAVPWITHNVQLFRTLRIVRLAALLGGRSSRAASNDSERAALAVAVFERVALLSRERGSTPVFVLLGERSGGRSAAYENWRGLLRAALKEEGFAFVDLVPRFRALTPRELDSFFIARGAAVHPHAAGHYTAAGNDFVARVIFEELERIPAVADRLAEVRH